MVKIENNCSSIKQTCLCGEIENLEHLYLQFSENKNEEVTPYEEIYSNNISKQVKVLRRFENIFLATKIKSVHIEEKSALFLHS